MKAADLPTAVWERVAELDATAYPTRFDEPGDRR